MTISISWANFEAKSFTGLQINFQNLLDTMPGKNKIPSRHLRKPDGHKKL